MFKKSKAINNWTYGHQYIYSIFKIYILIYVKKHILHLYSIMPTLISYK